jgi:holo-[acyl-carrier protein] synthase
VILGTGIDIVDSSRFRRIHRNLSESVFRLVFTGDELDFCANRNNTLLHLAGFFAVKEAVFKALELQWQPGFSWKDIEVCYNQNRSPFVRLSGNAEKKARTDGAVSIITALSFRGSYAIGSAVACDNRHSPE